MNTFFKKLIFKKRLKFVLSVALALTASFTLANKSNQNLSNTKVTFIVEEVTLLDIFDSFENQTSFRFVYDNDTISADKTYTYAIGETNLRNALDILEKDTDVRFHVVSKSISVTKIPPIVQQPKEVKGKVTDSNGLPLPGATIIVEGSNTGTSTDLEGDFSIVLPKNAEALIISFVGFKPQRVVLGNQSNYSISLEEDVKRLSEVTVSGFRKSLEEGIDIKKNSINTVDAVVAEDIAKFPQSNMAEALQRVSGIQIRRDNAGGVGNAVSIRGLPSEYTQVTLNGDALPNSSDGRSYDFNTLPAEIFKQVEVTKAPTASTTEGGIGGSVNLITKKPFELKKQVMVLTAEGLYNTQSQDEANATPKWSMTYGNKWNKKFGLIAGVFYNQFANTSEGYDVTRYYTESYDLDNDGTNEFENIQVPRFRYVSQGQVVNRLSTNLSMQYQVNDNFDLVFEGLMVYNGQVESRYAPVWITPGNNASNIIVDGPLVKEITYDSARLLAENQQQTNITKNYRWSVRGKYKLPNKWKLGAKFIHAFNKRDSERFRYYADNTNAVTYSITDDHEFFKLTTPTNLSNADQFRMYRARRYLWDYSDEIFTGKFDVVKKINSNFEVELGGSYRDRTKTQRHFFRDDQSINDPFRPVAKLLTGFLDNVDQAKGHTEFVVHDFDKAYELYGKHLDLEDYERIDAAYDINEKISAGFIQGNYRAGKFSTNAGLRVVHTAILSRGYQLDDATQIYQVLEIPSDYTDLLPSANIKWEFLKGVIARAGFARVITRPRLQDLSSYRAIDDINKRINSKNPELDPFRANQYDLTLEWYPKPETLISVGGFYKDIESFISQNTSFVMFNGEQYELRQPINGNNAVIKGFEVNFQQPFTFLPGFLGGFGIVANFTFAESDFEDTQIDTSSGTTIVKVVNYPLPNNSKYTLNVTPYYEKNGFSFRVATNFRSKFLRGIPDPVVGQKYRGDVTITDISSSYDVNKNFGLTLNVLNAFNAKRYEFIDDMRYMDNASFFGTTFQLGARFKF